MVERLRILRSDYYPAKSIFCKDKGNAFLTCNQIIAGNNLHFNYKNRGKRHEVFRKAKGTGLRAQGL
jgi:hypothetical protein